VYSHDTDGDPPLTLFDHGVSQHPHTPAAAAAAAPHCGPRPATAVAGTSAERRG
jgi:hypothetical protein